MYGCTDPSKKCFHHRRLLLITMGKRRLTDVIRNVTNIFLRGGHKQIHQCCFTQISNSNLHLTNLIQGSHPTWKKKKKGKKERREWQMHREK